MVHHQTRGSATCRASHQPGREVCEKEKEELPLYILVSWIYLHSNMAVYPKYQVGHWLPYGRLASPRSQGRLSVIVVSIISGEPSDPRPAPILRLKLLSELSMGHAAGRAAALRGLGSTPLCTRHQPRHHTDSPDRDSGRHGVPNRTYLVPGSLLCAS